MRYFVFPRIKSLRLFILLVLCLLLAFLLSGCAHFTVPAPDDPVKAFSEPAIENSTITMPVTISLRAIMRDLGLSGTDSAEGGTNRRSIIAANIRRFLRRQASKKESRLVQNIYARQQAGRAWSVLQTPINLKKDLSLFLNPQALSVSDVSQEDDNIQFVIGLVAKPRLVAGTRSSATEQPVPVISSLSEPAEPGFHIALDTEIGFDALSRELTSRFKGRTYAAGAQSVSVEKARIYGSGEVLVIAISIKGSVAGVVYLSGIPSYGPSARSLSVQKLQYTLETKNILAKAASWLLQTQLEESLAKRATWYIGDRIDAARDMVSGALNRNLNKHVSITGKIDALRPVAVGLTQTAIKAVLEADGTVEMQIAD